MSRRRDCGVKDCVEGGRRLSSTLPELTERAEDGTEMAIYARRQYGMAHDVDADRTTTWSPYPLRFVDRRCDLGEVPRRRVLAHIQSGLLPRLLPFRNNDS